MITDPNMVLLHMKKRNIVLNKNISAGSVIFEISIKLKLEVYYNLCKVQWKENRLVLVYYMETYNFKLEVITENLPEDLENVV
jgi:hypothetical protein